MTGTATRRRAGEPCVALDIGGTKIAAATVTPTGAVLARATATTPRHGAAAVIAAAAELVSAVSGGAPPLALGVGAPGVIDRAAGRVVSATDVLPDWVGADVGSELQRLCGCPVVVDNDVRMMAVGEALHGAGKAHGEALYVSVGTGVGGAIWRDGEVVRGPHSTAGEIAHLLVPAQGAVPCGCGRRDHVEAAASGPAIEAAHTARTGCQLELPDIAALIDRGDRTAVAVVEQAAAVLGRALAGFVSAIDVEAVIVGGGVSLLGERHLAPLRRALCAEVLEPLRQISVVRAQLGTDAPLIGAAMVAFDLVDRSRGATSAVGA